MCLCVCVCERERETYLCLRDDAPLDVAKSSPLSSVSAATLAAVARSLSLLLCDIMHTVFIRILRMIQFNVRNSISGIFMNPVRLPSIIIFGESNLT